MESIKKAIKNIDGSMLEGGGQLFRTSIALSYLLNQPLHISKIRANRPKGGGLSNQHLMCVQTLFGFFQNYQISGNKIKSTELTIQTPDAKSVLDENFI